MLLEQFTTSPFQIIFILQAYYTKTHNINTYHKMDKICTKMKYICFYSQLLSTFRINLASNISYFGL